MPEACSHAAALFDQQRRAHLHDDAALGQKQTFKHVASGRRDYRRLDEAERSLKQYCLFPDLAERGRVEYVPEAIRRFYLFSDDPQYGRIKYVS
jgi:hypothetical protein